MPSSLTARTAARRRDWVVEACLASVESPKNKTKTPSLSSTGASTLALSRLLSRRALHLPTAKHLPPPHKNLIELSHHSHTHKAHTKEHTRTGRVGTERLRPRIPLKEGPPRCAITPVSLFSLLHLSTQPPPCKRLPLPPQGRCCRHKALLPPPQGAAAAAHLRSSLPPPVYHISGETCMTSVSGGHVELCPNSISCCVSFAFSFSRSSARLLTCMYFSTSCSTS